MEIADTQMGLGVATYSLSSLRGEKTTIGKQGVWKIAGWTM